MPLKIATIAPSFYPAHSYGGPIRSTLQLAQGLVRAGCEVRVLTTNSAGKQHTLAVDTRSDQLLPGGVRIRYTRRVLPESVAPQLLAALPEYLAWCDVVQLVGNYNFPTFPTLLGARIADKPLFWSPRGALQRWSGARKLGLKTVFEHMCQVLLPRTTVLHVTSEEEGRASSERLRGVPYVVIPNGVQVPEQVQHAPPLPDGHLRLAFLGRLDPKKGIPNLLAACALLADRGVSRFELTIAGAGEPAYEQVLQAQARALLLDVRFSGELPDERKAQFFAHTDILVMPSFTENFGIVAAEALAHGVPVIASRATPWSELETHDCGRWVDNTPEAIADAIVQLSQRDLLQLGARGRKLVSENYSWDTLCLRMRQSYETALAAHRSLE